MDESFQRSKLGHRLYRKLEEKLLEEGVRMVIADTDAGNNGAIKFFEVLGFTNRAKHVWLAKTLQRTAKSASRLE